MKKILLFAGILLLAACGGNSDSTSTHESVEELKTHTLPRIEGVWVMTDYITKMEAVRSPKQASDVLDGIVVLAVNKKYVRADSMDAGVNWNNHEGLKFTIYFKRGIAENSLQTSLKDDKGFFEIAAQDSTMVLYHYDAGKKLIDKRSFTKVLRQEINSDMSFGIEYIVNKKLFKGMYACTDSLAKKSDVELTIDGKIKGLEDYKYYVAATDFMDEYSNLDYIIFVKNEKSSETLGYRNSNDSIYFYTINRNEKDATISYGKLRYTFVRKK